MRKSILIRNTSLITETGECLSHRDLLIRDGIIAKICEAGVLKAADDVDEVIDGSRYFVSPGLCNLHAHTAMNIFKGIAEDVTSDAWFNEMIWPYESKMSPEDIYTGTVLGIAEMLDNGVTAVCDHYFGEEQVLKAAKDTGIRMDIAPTIFGMSPDYKDRLASVSEFIQKHQDDSDRISLRLGPHSNYTCPENVLGEIVDEARRIHVPIHLHLSETELQVQQSLSSTGKTPFQCLYDAGGFDVGVLVAHGLWVTEKDLSYLNENTWFAFCPKTYMKLAMGYGPFFTLSDRIRYSFGTDGAASSNTLSIAEQARLFGLLEKFTGNDPTIHPARSIWQKTMAGHRVFKAGTGVLQEGATADLVIWDLETPDTMAFYDPVSAILYSSNSRNVRYTMVAGEFLKYDGRLAMDFEEIGKTALRLQKELLARGKGKAIVYY